MPIVLKKGEIAIKNRTTGEYDKTINVVAEQTTEGMIEDIRDEGTTQIGLVEAKGESVMSDIPASYDDLNNIIADSYDSTKTYNVGDYVRYYDGSHDNLYKCIADTSEDVSWTSPHWEQIILSEEISNLNSAVTDLNDDLFDTNLVELDTTELDGYYNWATWVDDTLRSTKKADVSGLTKVRICVETAKYYNIYTFTDSNGDILSFLRADTSAVMVDEDFKVPINAKWVYVSTNTKAKGQNTKVYKYVIDSKIQKLESNQDKYLLNGKIVFTKNEHNIQIIAPFEKTNKYISIVCSDNGSANSGFNFLRYDLLDSIPKDETESVPTTLYKGSVDDVCPIHYNGSYRGANHGKSPTYELTVSGHDKTIADIGSVWKYGNHKYVLYKIKDENTLCVIGDVDSSRNDIDITSPTSPLTHESGATHTSNIVFSSKASVQMYPTFKNYKLVIIDENGKQITSNGIYHGNRFFQIDESYECFSIKAIIAYLKLNVGNNTNDSYYSNDIASDLLVQNSYHFYTNGACVVSCNATPLMSGVYIEYWGGVQSGKIGDDIYAPFTEYDTIQTQGNTSIELLSSTWNDIDFPAYKMYQFSGNNGFSVGYCIDYGQGLPNLRKEKIDDANGAGFWYTSHKMYPHFCDYRLEDAPDLYGDSLSFYAYRAPVIKDQDHTVLWYEAGSVVYIEIELFSSMNIVVSLPEQFSGKKITIVKKSDSISIPSDISGANGIFVVSTAAGSATLKLT